MGDAEAEGDAGTVVLLRTLASSSATRLALEAASKLCRTLEAEDFLLPRNSINIQEGVAELDEILPMSSDRPTILALIEDFKELRMSSTVRFVVSACCFSWPEAELDPESDVDKRRSDTKHWNL